jgi:hypothetical protein
MSPKDEQAHMYNSQLNSQLRACAASFISEVGAAFPLIRSAVRKAMTKGSAVAILAPADLEDFPTTALTEAATALSFQRAGYKVLSASAQAGAAHASIRGTRAVAQLGDAFDLFASRLIDDGRVIVALSPADVALGVLPLLPLALHLWFAFHAPSAAAPSSVVAAAEKFVFVRQGKLDFSSDLYILNGVYSKVKGADEEFDVDMAYGHLIRVMATARDHELTAELRSGR